MPVPKMRLNNRSPATRCGTDIPKIGRRQRRGARMIGLSPMFLHFHARGVVKDLFFDVVFCVASPATYRSTIRSARASRRRIVHGFAGDLSLSSRASWAANLWKICSPISAAHPETCTAFLKKRSKACVHRRHSKLHNLVESGSSLAKSGPRNRNQLVAPTSAKVGRIPPQGWRHKLSRGVVNTCWVPPGSKGPL